MSTIVTQHLFSSMNTHKYKIKGVEKKIIKKKKHKSMRYPPDVCWRHIMYFYVYIKNEWMKMWCKKKKTKTKTNKFHEWKTKKKRKT